MASKTRTSSKDRAQEAGLTALPFETPKPRYESKATYRNDRGQEFRIWVNGFNKATVQQFTKAVRVRLEIVPDDGTQLPSTDSLPTPQRHVSQEQPDEVSQQEVTVDQLAAHEREITIGVITTAGIQPPYLLHMIIDPPITAEDVSGHGRDIFVFLDGATTAHADITVTANSVQAQFGKMRQKRFEGIGDAITVNVPETKSVDGGVSNLALAITNPSSLISEYEIRASVRLISDG